MMSPQLQQEDTEMITESDEIAFEKGIEQGIEEGLRSGQLRLNLRLIENKFGAPNVERERRVSALPTEKLEDFGIAPLRLETGEEVTFWLDAQV